MGRNRRTPADPAALASGLCYALGPVGALYFLKLSHLRHLWGVRMHSCHSILLTALFLGGWAVFALLESTAPWFLSTLLRHIRIFAMSGAALVWTLAAIAATRGQRFVAIPILHELAVKMARHLEHKEQIA